MDFVKKSLQGKELSASNVTAMPPLEATITWDNSFYLAAGKRNSSDLTVGQYFVCVLECIREKN